VIWTRPMLSCCHLKKLTSTFSSVTGVPPHGANRQQAKLQNFVQNHLGLQWDEFNRVPVAGRSNIDRLREMLDAAAFAFLILTAEDEMADGDLQARMNVVHEAGLFQGRLGFEKAIALLEDGCNAFSNIDGLV
jgi:predicted nucleotide-binding protein